MGKRLFFFAAVGFFFFACTMTYAKDNGNANHGLGSGIQEIFMTEFFGINDTASFSPVENFPEDTTPWLYLKLATEQTEATGTWWFWNKGNQDYELSFDTALLTAPWLKEESSNPDGSRNIWLTRTDITDFTAHDQWWHVNNVHASCPNGGGSTKYHVTPEPASTALFILGAAAFGFGIFRKKTA